ncbi:hypothetical protein IMCC26134_15000 [Verrucomicrobia bacterium IMCC26134]|nr:hypothetical protein IMCC26134_15000 [Verrucomicrobia bacterium IMCC26134]
MNLTLDLNTVLTSLTLAGILWVLRTVSQQEKAQAVAHEKADTHDREIIELRSRVVTAEASVAEVSLRVARLEGSSGVAH